MTSTHPRKEWYLPITRPPGSKDYYQLSTNNILIF